MKDLDERMEEYEQKRKEALQAIKKIHGGNPSALRLSEVVALMPSHPEWVEWQHSKRKKRK